jgi:hypothetical protein
MPIGIGPLASGGGVLRLEIRLTSFADPVDLYLGILIPDQAPFSLCMLKPELIFQNHQEGIIPWKTNVTGPVSETLFEEIPVTSLPASKYYVYLAATPAGQDFSSGYYLWSTQFEIGMEEAPWWWRIFAYPIIVDDECVCDFLNTKSTRQPMELLNTRQKKSGKSLLSAHK